jgi:hypothetical protein
LEKQIEKFSFSRLPKCERIAQILVQALSAQVTFSPPKTAVSGAPYNLYLSGDVDFLKVADLIEKYALGDFIEPFQEQVFRVDAPLMVADIVEG